MYVCDAENGDIFSVQSRNQTYWMAVLVIREIFLGWGRRWTCGGRRPGTGYSGERRESLGREKGSTIFVSGKDKPRLGRQSAVVSACLRMLLPVLPVENQCLHLSLRKYEKMPFPGKNKQRQPS